jgi:ferredoxin
MLTRTIINLISELKAETRIFRLCRLINENSLYFDRVKEVEKGSKKRVYDILDSATESFTVNQLTVHNCGFGAQCATCTVQVLEGHQNLSHIDEEEEKRYKADGLTIADPRDPDGGSNLEKGRIACRMSCACQVYGDVIVRQPPG